MINEEVMACHCEFKISPQKGVANGVYLTQVFIVRDLSLFFLPTRIQNVLYESKFSIMYHVLWYNIYRLQHMS